MREEGSLAASLSTSHTLFQENTAMSKTDFTTLTIERLREVLDYCPGTGLFTWKVNRGPVKAGDLAGSADTHGYRHITVNGKIFLAHRLSFFYVYERWPDGDIDHKNGIKTDNRILNLREATVSKNMQNRKINKNASSPCKGVCWLNRSRRWVAQIQISSVKIHLGQFIRLEDAIAARKAAEITHHPFRVTTQ